MCLRVRDTLEQNAKLMFVFWNEFELCGAYCHEELKGALDIQ